MKIPKKKIKDTFSGVKKDHCVSCGISLEGNDYDKNGNYCDHCCFEAILNKGGYGLIKEVLKNLEI